MIDQSYKRTNVKSTKRQKEKKYYYQVCPQQVNPDVCIVTVGTQPRPSANLLATILLPSNSLPGIYFFLRPKSDRWLPLSGTDQLTHCCLVNFIDVTLACEDANSKLVEVVTVADLDSEDYVGNCLLQIWELAFGPKTKLFFRL